MVIETVKISLCICVVLSWDELKVRQNLLDSDYEIYMVRLLVTTVNWYKSLQFVKEKSNITLLPCLFLTLLAVQFWCTHFCLLERCKKRKQQQTKNSKNTPARDVRLKIVIVMSAQDEVREFWRALLRLDMLISKGKLNNTEYIVQINREISLTKVCLTYRHHATFFENNELFIV